MGYSSDPWNLQKNATMSCTVDSFFYTVQCTSICDLRLRGHDLQQPCWSILICRMEKRSLRSISGGQQVKSGIGALISCFKFSDFVAQLSGSLVASALPSLKAKAPGKATWKWFGVFFCSQIIMGVIRMSQGESFRALLFVASNIFWPFADFSMVGSCGMNLPALREKEATNPCP